MEYRKECAGYREGRKETAINAVPCLRADWIKLPVHLEAET